MDRRIVSRLLAPLACVSLLLLLTATGSAWYARATQQRVSAMLNSNVASVRAARDLENCVRDVDTKLDRFLVTGDRAHLEAVRGLRGRALDALAEAEAVAFTPEEQELMARARSGCEKLFAGHDRVLHEPPGAVSRAEIDALSAIPDREILEPVKEYARVNDDALARSGRQNEQMTGPLTAVFLAVGLCGAGGGLLGGWVIATGVRRVMLRTETRLLGTAGRLSAVVPPGPHAGDPAEWVDESVSALLDRFRRAERDALRAEQLARVGQMAAGIAHEIRNPLMAIKILIQAAADPLREVPFRTKDLAVIEREIARLEQTVRGFVDFARPPRPEKQPVDLNALLEQTVAGLRARAERQGVALGAEVPADPVALTADPNQFGQVVYNLIYNALDAQPAGGRVRVRAGVEAREPPAPAELVLRVEDEGAGLPAGLGERIFDPFVSTKETGLGLGLSICRRIVEDHGGTICAAPRPGRGRRAPGSRVEREPDVANLLIVDDEESLLYSLEAGLATDDVEVHTATTGREGVAAVRARAPDAVILDVRLPDMTGLEAFDQIRALDPRLPVVLITAYAAAETAIEAVKRGAFDYLLKPVDLHHLRDTVARAIELRRVRSVPTALAGEPAATDADEVVGRSPAMQAVYRAIGLLAPQTVPVLITGESGTGKELIARTLYQHSARAGQPLLTLDCTATPEAALEAELFGHETAAEGGRRKIGKFEQADGGTVYLDEIADLSPAAQAKLLSVLQERQFDRGGAAVTADVRVIASTGQDLNALVAAGQFRRDLLYRLNGFAIALPALRDRPGDVPLLADYFLRQAARRLGKSLRSVAPEAVRLLERHAWAGNVRELQNVVRFAAIQATGDVVTPDCLPATLRGEGPAAATGEPVDLVGVRRLVQNLLGAGSLDVYRRVLLEVERAIIGDVLEHVGGNQVQASELLGISRNTLRARIQAFERAARKSDRPAPGSG